MTTETRRTATEGINYDQVENVIGLNWYDADPNLKQLVERLAAPEDRAFSDRWLRRMGGVVGTGIAARAEVTDKNPPRLEKYDHWGNEVNEIVHHQGSLDTKRDLWENGFIGLRWSDEVEKQRGGHLPPVVSTGFSYLLSEAETGMLCAIGMTSSAASIIEKQAPPEIRDRFLPHMTTMNYDEAWDGGMFLTEQSGGSDLASSDCSAVKTAEGWRINGAKWFCSNLDAEAILALARPEGADAGLGGLALFLIPKRRSDGTRNGMHIRRLKDKLGTKAVPTGEVDFVDAEAYLMGSGRAGDDSAARDGKGIKRMMEMVQSSRFGVSLMGLGIMRRSFMEAAVYAHHRYAFGRPIAQYPLVRETLVNMATEVEAGCAISFEAAEAGARKDDDSRRLYRILVPLAKFRNTRRGIDLASQAVEIHGGNGYIENWPVARQLRDAQCHTIWEGAENIICLDVLRAIAKERSDEALFGRIEQALGGAEHPVLTSVATDVGRALDEVKEAAAYIEHAPQDMRLLHAKRLTDYMADVAQASLLVEEAVWELANKNSARKAIVARHFANMRLGQPRARGIMSDDRTVLDYFEPIVRYQPVAREDLA